MPQGSSFMKNHYLNYPCVLVRLSRVRADALRDLVTRRTPLCERQGAEEAGRTPVKSPRARGSSGTGGVAPNGRLEFLRWSGGVVGGSIAGDGTTTTGNRDVTVVVHLTGRPARGCDGTSRAGPLVVEYRNEGDGWLATARTRGFPASPTPLDDFLAGDLRVDSGELETIGARAA
jgi:hypothetical protein